MKEIILSSGIDLVLAHFYFMPYTYSRTKCFTRVLSIVFMYIGYLVVKSIFTR